MCGRKTNHTALLILKLLKIFNFMKTDVSFWPVLQGVAIVAGTIIGAGVLGVPYAISQVGVVAGGVLLLLVGFCMTLVMLYVADVAATLRGRHQLAGYIEKYLGSTAKKVLTIALAINIYGAMLGYTIGQGTVLASLFTGSEFLWSVIFFSLFSLFIVFGIHVIKRVEVFLTALVALLLVAIIVYISPSIQVNELSLYKDLSAVDVLTTYGILLFACFGLTAVPQVREILKHEQPQLFKRAVFIGAVVPVVLYGAFAFAVLGVTGDKTSNIATLELGNQVGTLMVLMGSVLAFFAMASSFVALGLALRTIYEHDYGLPSYLAVLITLLVPIALFVLGLRDFIEVVSFVGGLSISLVGMVIVVLHFRMRSLLGERKTVVQYFLYSIVFIIFLVGMLSTIVSRLI